MGKKPQRPIGRPKGSGSRKIYEAVKDRILSMDMAPGSLVDENALVAEFGVSRTPVREALIKLSTDGLVSLSPNRGATVSALDIDELPELLEGIELCMRVTSRWAALRRTEPALKELRRRQEAFHAASQKDDFLAMNEANSEFHLAIARSARNRHLVRFYQGMLPQYHRLTLSLLTTAKFWAPRYKAYFTEVSREHENLIAAIEAGDAERADKIAQAHARQIGKRLDAFIWNSLSGQIEIGDPPPQRKRTQGSC